MGYAVWQKRVQDNVPSPKWHGYCLLHYRSAASETGREGSRADYMENLPLWQGEQWLAGENHGQTCVLWPGTGILSLVTVDDQFRSHLQVAGHPSIAKTHSISVDSKEPFQHAVFGELSNR